MPRTRIVGLMGVLVCALTLPAVAALDRYLPTSSFMEGSAYGTGHQIDYAVYDLVDHGADLEGHDWFDLTGMLSGRYVYAYQVFNISANDIWSFTVAGITEGSLAGIAAVGRLDDGSEGVAPTYWWVTPSFTESNWRFDDEQIVPDTHSWVLVMTSDHAPIETTYRINQPSSGLPGPGLPEPATLLLLGLGAGYIRWRRAA